MVLFRFFLLLNCLRIAATFLPGAFLFGLDLLRFLPLPLAVFWAVLGIAFLNYPVNRRVGDALEGFGRLLYNRQGGFRALTAGLILFFCVFIFYFLRVKPYLGDGVSVFLILESRMFIH